MLKKIILLTLLVSSSIIAEEFSGNESINYCIPDNQQIDTSTWVEYPITFKVSYNDTVTEEKIKISFPSEPTVEINEIPQSCFTMTDKEGMVYSLAAMKVPEKDFNLREQVDILAESISKSSNKNLVCRGWPVDNSNDTIQFIHWTQGDKMTRLTLIQSGHLIYFIETSVRHEVYKDFLSIQIDTEAFDICMHDSLKTGAFYRSFSVVEAQ